MLWYIPVGWRIIDIPRSALTPADFPAPGKMWWVGRLDGPRECDHVAIIQIEVLPPRKAIHPLNESLAIAGGMRIDYATINKHKNSDFGHANAEFQTWKLTFALQPSGTVGRPGRNRTNTDGGFGGISNKGDRDNT